MGTRLLQFVARTSNEKSIVVDPGDGVVVVKKNDIIEVDARVARDWLRDPGASDDSGAEWVPAPRET